MDWEGDGADKISGEARITALTKLLSSVSNVTAALFQDFMDRHGKVKNIKWTEWKKPVESCDGKTAETVAKKAWVCAIQQNNVELVRLYIEHFRRETKHANFPFIIKERNVNMRLGGFAYAMICKSTEMALMIMADWDNDMDALPDWTYDGDGKKLLSPLMLACAMDNWKVVRAMTGVPDMNARDLCDRLDLTEASESGFRGFIRGMGRTDIDMTAIMVAAKHSRPEILQRLLEIDRASGVHTVNAIKEKAELPTALFCAVYCDKSDVVGDANVQLILQYVSDEVLETQNLNGGNGETAFNIVCGQHKTTRAVHFLNRDPTLVTRNSGYSTPFMRACGVFDNGRWGRPETLFLQFLIERGADPFALPAGMNPFSADYDDVADYTDPAVPMIITDLFQSFVTRFRHEDHPGNDSEDNPIGRAYEFLRNETMMTMLCKFVELAAGHQSSAQPLEAVFFRDHEQSSINSLCYLAVVVPGDKGGDRLKSCLRFYFPALVPAWERAKASSMQWGEIHDWTHGSNAPDVDKLRSQPNPNFDGFGGGDEAAPQASFCDVCL